MTLPHSYFPIDDTYAVATDCLHTICDKMCEAPCDLIGVKMKSIPIDDTETCGELPSGDNGGTEEDDSIQNQMELNLVETVHNMQECDKNDEASDCDNDSESIPESSGGVDIESMLKIPSTIMFPLELSRYLKEKLTAVVEDNWHLTKHIQSLEYELIDLRKFKNEFKDTMVAVKKEPPSLLSTKVIELSKRNRDMTAQMEGMKNKIQKLTAENEMMKHKLSTAPPGLDTMSIDGSVLNTSRTNISDVSSVNQQLNKTTAKMMEYRRQNQLLQMELRTALRALCQEVGEGTTPKSVLKEVSGPESTWRGRQQHIIALTQKVSELQIKLTQQSSFVTHQDCSDDDQRQGLHTYQLHSGCQDMGGGGDTLRNSNIPVLSINPGSKRQISALQNYDKRKQNHLEKLTQDFNELQTDLKSSQLEAKGFKARTQVLESQVRSLRVELDDTGVKFRSKQESLQQSHEELKEIRQELITFRDRERKHRELSNTELHDANQALARERSVVVRLQKLIAEKQEHLQRLDSKVARLQDDVQVYSTSTPGGVENTEKIKSLENQLQLATQSIHTAEKERERLLNLISNSVGEAQQERQNHNEAERLLSRSFAILNLTDSCINRCLDVGQVTSKPVLEEVEEIRALVRELKAKTHHTGVNYSSDDFELPKIFPHQPSIFATNSSYSNHQIDQKFGSMNNLTLPKESQEKPKTRNDSTHRQFQAPRGSKTY